MTLNLNLIVLRVKDIDASARFYAALGITFKREQHGRGPIHLTGEAGQVLLELYPAGQGACSEAVRLGFSVCSLEGMLESIAAAGGTVVSEPKPGPGGVRAVLADPDGNRVELVESAR